MLRCVNIFKTHNSVSCSQVQPVRQATDKCVLYRGPKKMLILHIDSLIMPEWNLLWKLPWGTVPHIQIQKNTSHNRDMFSIFVLCVFIVFLGLVSFCILNKIQNSWFLSHLYKDLTIINAPYCPPKSITAHIWWGLQIQFVVTPTT